VSRVRILPGPRPNSGAPVAVLRWGAHVVSARCSSVPARTVVRDAHRDVVRQHRGPMDRRRRGVRARAATRPPRSRHAVAPVGVVAGAVPERPHSRDGVRDRRAGARPLLRRPSGRDVGAGSRVGPAAGRAARAGDPRCVRRARRHPVHADGYALAHQTSPPQIGIVNPLPWRASADSPWAQPLACSRRAAPRAAPRPTAPGGADPLLSFLLVPQGGPNPPPSSSGLGRRPFKAEARVRIPLGARTEVAPATSARQPNMRLWRSPESSPPCQGGDRGIEARQARWALRARLGWVAQLAEHAAENRGVGSSILPPAT
jgi:hypothetical protein